MKAGKTFRVNGGCASDIGISREVNQDAIIFQKLEQRAGCFAVGAVCDGVGGMQSGEAASALVIDGVEQWFEKICEWIDIAKVDCDVLFAHLKDAAEQWNQSVVDYCKSRQIRSGTTMSLIMAIRDRFYILHVGDSRIYRYNTCLERLTLDDTVIKQVDGKERAYLANYMGRSDSLSFTTVCGRMRKGDLFLYCSDGFYHKLEEADMMRYQDGYKKNQPLDRICKEAVRTMEQRAETDNISAGMIVIEPVRRQLGKNPCHSRDGTRKRNASRENTINSETMEMQSSRTKWFLRTPNRKRKQSLQPSNKSRSSQKPVQEKRQAIAADDMETNKKISKKRSVFGIGLWQLLHAPLFIK